MRLIIVHHEPGSGRAERLYQALASTVEALLGVRVERRTPSSLDGKPDAPVVSLFALPGPHHYSVERWAGPNLRAGPIPPGILALHVARLTPPGAGSATIGYVAHGDGGAKRRWAETVAEKAARLTRVDYRVASLPHGCRDPCIPLVLGPGRHNMGKPTILEASFDLVTAWLASTLQDTLRQTLNTA